MYFPEALKKIHRKMRPGLVSVVLRKRADEDSDGTPGGVAVQPPLWTSPRATASVRRVSTWPDGPSARKVCFLSESVHLPEMDSFHFSKSAKVFISFLFSKYVFTHYRWTVFFLSIL